MNASKTWLAVLFVSPLFASMPAGCGQQLVQFALPVVTVDGAADSSMADMSLGVQDSSLADSRIPDGLMSDALMSDGMMSDGLMPDLMMRDLVMGDGGPRNPGPLGSLESYAIVASSTITNSGPTTIIGSIALSPGPMISGIPMGMPINGSIHVADNPAAQAQMDLTFAYNFEAGKPCGTNLTGMDLGGKTLAPGVYCFNSSAGMAIGSTLILDAQGDPDASWTFQIASTLILGNFAKIHVINGGRDCSVYWQVGSSATLGIGARLAGNLLAQASITMTFGASAGRALARTGGVTMDTNDVAIGPCR